MPDASLALPIILDGENAWEHFPENGYYFLRALYEKLADHPSLKLSTFTECLDEGVEIGQLSTLVSGSWVYGTLLDLDRRSRQEPRLGHAG